MVAQQLQTVTPIDLIKPSVSVVFVTPEMATRWLKQMPRNRTLRKQDVAKYARDMRWGRWEMTGETIKFAKDNTLLDGQHRLHAVVASDAVTPFYVVRGLDPEAQRVMDTGRKRSAADALTLAGHGYTARLAAVCRLALGVEAGIADPGRFEATHAEIGRFVEDNPDVVYACEFGSNLARKTDCPPAVVCYTFWRLARIDTFEAANFWTTAATKENLSAGDPVLTLTNRFAEQRRRQERVTKATYLSMIYRAWNARRAGATLTLLRVNSSAGGTVPIPEPK